MAAVLLHHTAHRNRVVAEARSYAEPRDIEFDVVGALAELGHRAEVGGRAERLTPDVASMKPFVVAIGDVAQGFPSPIVTWPSFDLHGGITRARVVRDALLSFIVLLAEQHGWVDSTERWARPRRSAQS